MKVEVGEAAVNTVGTRSRRFGSRLGFLVNWLMQGRGDNVDGRHDHVNSVGPTHTTDRQEARDHFFTLPMGRHWAATYERRLRLGETLAIEPNKIA